MTEKERMEFKMRADKMVKRLSAALSADEESDKVPCKLMMYATAKFAASVLLTIQEETFNFHVEDDFTQLIKFLMKILGKDMKIQSLKNERESLEKQMAENEEKLAMNEKRIEQYDNEIAQYKKQIADKEMELDAIRNEKGMLLGTIIGDDDRLN